MIYECVQYNDNYYKIIMRNNVITKRVKDECLEDFFENFEDVKIRKEESDRVSLSRTKRNIKEICLCNDFEEFATITINSEYANRFSLSECQDKLKKTLKRIKRNNGGFKYIFITEKHEDGAFHFHGLIKGLYDDSWEINQNGYVSNKYFNELGFNSFSKIKNYNKCCNYIMKYITKDCIKNENNQIYICSRGLKKATRTSIDSLINFNKLKFYRKDRKGNCFSSLYYNDYITSVEFDLSELNSEQLKYFFEFCIDKKQYK